jgi:hypothetical protein
LCSRAAPPEATTLGISDPRRTPRKPRASIGILMSLQVMCTIPEDRLQQMIYELFLRP